jgi:hypothetical protein
MDRGVDHGRQIAPNRFEGFADRARGQGDIANDTGELGNKLSLIRSPDVLSYREKAGLERLFRRAVAPIGLLPGGGPPGRR